MHKKIEFTFNYIFLKKLLLYCFLLLRNGNYYDLVYIQVLYKMAAMVVFNVNHFKAPGCIIVHCHKYVCKYCYSIYSYQSNNCYKKPCKVNGCVLNCQIHICNKCNATDSHRTKDCPKQFQCKVNGCKLNCKKHICNECGAIDSHRTKNCPKAKK